MEYSNYYWVFVSWNVVLEVGDGVFEVLSTSGDTHLGGDDFDKVSQNTDFVCLKCFINHLTHW